MHTCTPQLDLCLPENLECIIQRCKTLDDFVDLAEEAEQFEVGVCVCGIFVLENCIRHQLHSKCMARGHVLRTPPSAGYVTTSSSQLQLPDYDPKSYPFYGINMAGAAL